MSAQDLHNGIKLVALASASFLVGINGNYSHVWVPTLLLNTSDTNMLAQWRYGYVSGFRTVPRFVATSVLSFAYLAYQTPSSLARGLYIFSALCPPATILFTTRVMRPLLGALCRRTEKLVGPGSGTHAETFALEDKGAMEIEKRESSRELVRKWARYNWVRAIMPLGSVVAGGWAVLAVDR